MRRLRALPWKRIVLIGLPSGLLAVLVVLGVGYAFVDVPAPKDSVTEQATVLRYADGTEFARLGTNRVLVPLSQMSEPAQKAVLAAEDRGFYTEPGISPRGIARALFTNVRGGGSVQQGGSTITQQYAKNAFLTSDRTYTRKVKEVFISLKMTRQRSKEQILEDYLNTIYFGRGAYGIEAASRAYFGAGTSAADLTAAQGAVLASSIRSPAGYEPAKHPERARERWAYVLDGMVSEGWLDPAERTGAPYPDLARQRSASGTDLSGPEGHVVSAVTDELEARGFAEVGGLVVTTTLRKKAQAAAIEAVEKINDGDKADDALLGALVSVQPGSGKVVAYYGGANGQGYDWAGGQARQPGSSFKPYVLAAALEQDIPLTHRLDGNDDKTFPGLQRPISNFGDLSLGQVDLITATQKSVNTAYVELGLEVGTKKVRDLAHQAGVSEDMPLAQENGDVYAGIALGQYAVRPLDQAVGFATFANGGEAAEPYLLDTVEKGGKQVYTAKEQTRRAFSQDVAADATYAMQQVVEAGTGTRAQLDGRPAAGKTGTTSGNKDLWFAGYTPQLATAVWFGRGTNERVKIQGVDEATGGSISAGVFKDFMDVALEGEPVQDFPPRADVGDEQVVVAPVAPVVPAPTTEQPEPTSAPEPTRTTTSPTPSRTPTPTPTPTEEPTPTPTTSSPSPSSTTPSTTPPTSSRATTTSPTPSASGTRTRQPGDGGSGEAATPARAGDGRAGGA